jgi:drug/metabolite transporter (DMT)-like permease
MGMPAGRGGLPPLGAERRSGDPGGRSPGPTLALTFALVTGLFIASYTLWDKYAVSTLNVPPLIQGYAAMPVMMLVLAPFALRQRPRTALVWRTYRRQVAGAAVLAPLAYILVLAALSFTAVSAVAPAREVSVLAGVLLGRRLLGEGQLARRLAAAAAIAAGIICIALG